MSNSSDYYKVDGYWTDSGECFYGYVMCNYDYLIANDHGIEEEDVFYFGVSKSVAEQNIDEEWDDFVITSVYDMWE